MSYVETEIRDGAVWLWLNRPERHNALVPAMVSDLRSAIARAAAQDPPALVLAARGRSFSTGGDVAGFLENSGSLEALKDYSERLVGGLHAAILDLLAFPAPVLAAINGPVTGGSTGLMLAADLVAMVEDAFVQPYYSEVGFGPDGGWTALLPDRIGTAKALQIQYRNERIGAAEALVLGLATSICPSAELESQIRNWTTDIAKGFAQTHRATREKVWDDQRRAEVRSRLDQEKARFLELVTRPETLEGMRDFKKERA
ncbi:enoyl-CoA hydratase/isomerase family protein [Roseibium marinum]|uniref:2-(1,2-epoxy-1,2-dihydrophenyl)acetyl-CoA isomerase n=1 Tax=Roseibium marinum TaxID=281252 RepID=A0A2S3ULI7_9HYPH|nr:enoyl-CoA hydratase/isomerase family protein [Roseibium marinum]POF28566.1 2-(1,2-epoxy-1,2-dihydrophenyl)acetyl-CoA isomerase [Roseibium marinum]